MLRVAGMFIFLCATASLLVRYKLSALDEAGPVETAKVWTLLCLTIGMIPYLTSSLVLSLFSSRCVTLNATNQQASLYTSVWGLDMLVDMDRTTNLRCIVSRSIGETERNLFRPRKSTDSITIVLSDDSLYGVFQASTARSPEATRSLTEFARQCDTDDLTDRTENEREAIYRRVLKLDE